MAKFNKKSLKRLKTLPADGEVIVTQERTDDVYIMSKADFIAETVTPSVDAIPVVDAPTYLEVDISSAQILAMGTTPIEILPVAGANSYYEYYGIIEYTHDSTAYTIGVNDFISIIGDANWNGTYMETTLLSIASSKVGHFQSGIPQVVSNHALVLFSPLNDNLQLTTDTGADPTLGDGTMKVKIWYTVRTVG